MRSRNPKQLTLELASLRWFTCKPKNLGLVKVIIICYRRFLKNVNLKPLNINMMSRVTIVATMLDLCKVLSTFQPQKTFYLGTKTTSSIEGVRSFLMAQCFSEAQKHLREKLISSPRKDTFNNSCCSLFLIVTIINRWLDAKDDGSCSFFSL